MSWGITIKDLFVSRVSKDSIATEIEEQERLVRLYEDDLLVMCAESPRDYKDEVGNLITWEEHITMKFRQTIEEYKEAVNRLHILYIASTSEVSND